MSTAAASGDDSWRANIIDDDAEVAKLVRTFHKVAVLGIKTERQADQPAFYVAEYLKNAGIQVVPVPTYYPDVTSILGVPVFRTVAAAAAAKGALDCVDVFRRPSDVEAHLPDLLAAVPRPRAVWLQSGIRCPPAEEALARAGVLVVADRCLMVEHRAAAAGGSRM